MDVGAETRDLNYQRWKDVAPVIYDWIAFQHLTWPSLSCRWGHQTYKNKQQIYVSEQTDGTFPNTLVVATVQVGKSRASAAEHIAKFDEERGRSNLNKHKTIVHPGEVNRIRELRQNNSIVATHSDVPEVYIWNLESQPNAKVTRGGSPAVADLVLEGHTAEAPFALATSPSGPYVVSGGSDCKVVMWSIEDYTTSLQGSASGSARKTGGRRKSVAGLGTTVSARSIFTGHTASVEDVCFHPASFEELCSVGDDKALLIWDARTSTSAPVLQVQHAHDDDVHCVDWSAHDPNLILTGSADKTVKMFDRRKLGSAENVAVHTFMQHDGPVLCVQWHPETAAVFGSCAEDGLVNCWNYEQIGKENPKARFGIEDAEAPAELFFQHRGHRTKVVDFQWNPQDPWVVMSASDDGDLEKGGGTIQIWKMNEVVYNGGDVEKAELLESARQLSAAAERAKPVETKRKPEGEAAADSAKKTKLDPEAADANGAAPEQGKEEGSEPPPVAADASEALPAAEMAVDEAKAEEPAKDDVAKEVADSAAPMEGVEAAAAPTDAVKPEGELPEAPQPMDTAEVTADAVPESAVVPEAPAVAVTETAKPVVAPAVDSSAEGNGVAEAVTADAPKVTADVPEVTAVPEASLEIEAKAVKLSGAVNNGASAPAVAEPCPDTAAAVVEGSEEPKAADVAAPAVEKVKVVDESTPVEPNGGGADVSVAASAEGTEFAVPPPEKGSADAKAPEAIASKPSDVAVGPL